MIRDQEIARKGCGPDEADVELVDRYRLTLLKAAAAHVSVNTVRKQVATPRGKFRADTRAELVRKASAYGAIP